MTCTWFLCLRIYLYSVTDNKNKNDILRVKGSFTKKCLGHCAMPSVHCKLVGIKPNPPKMLVFKHNPKNQSKLKVPHVGKDVVVVVALPS